MKRLKNQRGSIDIILLIILFILLVVLAIWTYLNSQKKTDTPAAEPQKTESKAAAEKPVDDSWLNIDQFSVRGKKTANVTLQYEIKNGADYKAAYFTSKEQLALEPNCTAEFGAGGAISQYSKGGDYNGTMIENVPTAKKIGNYYYIYSQPQAYCSTAQANQAKEAAIQAAVKNVVATLEAKP
jgi:hypothetical protein